MVLLTKRLVAAAKFLVAATKILFVVPNFVAVTKPFFFREEVFPYCLKNLVGSFKHGFAGKVVSILLIGDPYQKILTGVKVKFSSSVQFKLKHNFIAIQRRESE